LADFGYISRKHVKISFENNTWFITDLGSSNKTFVGNNQAQPQVPVSIKNNDVVQLANIKFVVREA
jgi:pSer/pThr/pTyr-binding forkhead associated (FHA) protein